MKRQVTEYKSKAAHFFLSGLNKILVGAQFSEVRIEGMENLPKSGATLLVPNHSRRWDGLLVQSLVHRMANFLVHPNELKGLLGLMLRLGGAFPCDPKLDLKGYITRQFELGETVVIFPEGDI